MVEMVFENQEVCCRITYLPLVGRQQKAVGHNTIREFGIKHNCYAGCRVARVGEIAISLTVLSCSGGMVFCPERTNLPFRRSHFHSFGNASAKSL